MAILIKGGTLVTAEAESRGDILIIDVRNQFDLRVFIMTKLNIIV